MRDYRGNSFFYVRSKWPAIWYYTNRAGVVVYVEDSGGRTRRFRLTRRRLQRMLADLDDAPKEKP